MITLKDLANQIDAGLKIALQDNPIVYTYGEGATLPTDVTRAMYSFRGWSDSDKVFNEVTEIDAEASGDKTFYAWWQAATYTVTFHANDGTDATSEVSGLNNVYRVYLDEKANKNMKGNIYTVFYQNPDSALMPEHNVEFPFVKNGSCTMLGCFITNTVQVADAIKEKFTIGDKMTVKATGYLDGQKTGEAEFTLAEYTDQKDSIVSSWTLFDLKKLGTIQYIDFEVSSTNPEVPAYFCMDSMGANVELEY
jgi:hypothetical protein